MTGTRYQLYNGIMLVITFFGCRLCWGIYLSIKIYQDIYALHIIAIKGGSLHSHLASASQLEETKIYEVDHLPSWLIIIYLGSNTLLTFLNIYWFGQMLKAVKKRFPSKSLDKYDANTKAD